MGKNVLVLGSGGREHATIWKLSQSPNIGRIFAAPGNAGIRELADVVPCLVFDDLLRAISQNNIDLVVIGPENLLAKDVAGDLRAIDVPVFGPSRASARIETSKVFAKKLMAKANIPTAPFVCHSAGDVFRPENAPGIGPSYVVKADGLAGGKGVVICETPDEVNKAIEGLHFKHGDAAREVVIERFLKGQEVSCHLLAGGTGLYLEFPASCDYKKLDGKNTGGMGAVAPTSRLILSALIGMGFKIFDPVFNALRKETGEWFIGGLYPGIILTVAGPRVLEFNARFGDPETEVYMRLLDSDLLELLYACATGKLKEIPAPRWKPGYAVSVAIATDGYPDRDPERQERIYRIEEAEQVNGVVVFHGSTEKRDGHMYALGGRALHITAIGDTLREAITRVYEALNRIHFPGMQYRTDIGADLIGKI